MAKNLMFFHMERSLSNFSNKSEFTRLILLHLAELIVGQESGSCEIATMFVVDPHCRGRRKP